MTPDTQGYSLTARVFHWVTALLVLAAIPMAIIMNNIGEGSLQDFLFDMHRSIGVLLIPIALGRLFWRFGHPPPTLPDDIPAAQQLVARLTHYALYVLLIAQPILGWVASSAYRAPITVFWLFDLPPIWPENRALSEQLFDVHMWLGFTMGALVCAHIGAALFHHFGRRDQILLRMWSGGRA
jgi:cytochrome b561